jgi:hypothetical protein
LAVAGPVGIVDKIEHVFSLGFIQATVAKSSVAFCFFHSCGNFHRPPHFFLFGSFSFFVEKNRSTKPLYAAFGDQVDL